MKIHGGTFSSSWMISPSLYTFLFIFLYRDMMKVSLLTSLNCSICFRNSIPSWIPWSSGGIALTCWANYVAPTTNTCFRLCIVFYFSSSQTRSCFSSLWRRYLSRTRNSESSIVTQLLIMTLPWLLMYESWASEEDEDDSSYVAIVFPKVWPSAYVPIITGKFSSFLTSKATLPLSMRKQLSCVLPISYIYCLAGIFK